MVEPLEPGEHVDLDAPATVKRQDRNPNMYRLNVPNHHGGTDSVDLEDETIRELAELAGYDVSDPASEARRV